MTREAFHRALKELEKELLDMSGMVSDAIAKAMDSLMRRDLALSEKVVKDDILINRKRFEIEDKCLMLIATQQPMAVDLRVLAAAINIITDLERIADHAEGVAKINLSIGDEALVKPLIDMPKMSEKALSMLGRCMKAFVDRDVKTARRICDEDDEVDALYDEIYRELIHIMIEDPKKIKGATYLIWAAHNFERMADRVTNIAERVVYMVTGKMEELNVSKY